MKVKKRLVILSLVAILAMSAFPFPSLAQGWNVETVDSAADVGQHSSMALDSNDNPHISYYDADSGDLKYAHWDGANWSSETVDSTGDDVGQYSSIALDNDNNPHISYYDADSGDLKYAYWTGAVWTRTTVDTTGDVGQYSSIALDSKDNPHISYYNAGNTILKYACDKDGNGDFSDTGEIILADYEGNVGEYTSIAVDSDDNPHISYYDSGNTALKYACDKDGDGDFSNAGEIITVNNAGDVGTYTSIAIDSSNSPHFTYYDKNYKALKYACDKNGNGDFSDNHDILTIDIGADIDVGHYSSLALDSNDHPHISYYDFSNGDLKYAHWDGENWSSETVDSAGDDVGQFTSIAIDSNGYPHVSYYDVSNGNLKYARWTGSVPEDPAIGFSPGSFSFSATEGEANPANQTLNIWNSGDGTLDWSVSDDADWLSLNPASGNSTGEQDAVTLSVDTSGMSIGVYNATVSISASGVSNTPLVIVILEVSALPEPEPSGEWIFETVDDTVDVGQYSSIALDNNDYPHISYYDAGNGDLKYAYWTGADWVKITVDADGDVGQYSSIALYSVNQTHIIAHIAYYSSDYSGNLKYACDRNSDGDFSDPDEIITVDNSLVGGYCSMALDGNGCPHISYYTLTDNGNLKYACDRNGDGDFSDNGEMVIADGADYTGQWTSIAMDNDNHPHISYHDSSNTRLLYTCDINGDGDFIDSDEKVVVDDAGNVGIYTSIATDSSNSPYISYYAVTGNALKYASDRNGDGDISDPADILTIDEGDYVGQHNSIALDSSDSIHISYYDFSNGDLKYAYCDGANWSSETVDSNGDDVGQFTSIAIDSNDYPHISYYDAGNGNLKYAYLEEAPEEPAIGFSPGNFSFSATEGETNPSDKTLNVWNSGSGTLNWSVSDNADWLNLNPASGNSTGEQDAITVSVDISGISAGNYSATITITAQGATNATETVPVNLTLDSANVIWVFPATSSVFFAPSPVTGRPYINGSIALPTGTEPAELQGVYWLDDATGDWKYFIPNLTTNTLSSLEPGHAYLVSVSGACTWQLS